MNVAEFQRILKQAFFVPLLALLVLAGVVLWQVATAQRAQRLLDDSERISTQIDELEQLITDQESGLRGYELTRDREMLGPFDAAAKPIDTRFTTIRQLVADNPEQLSNLVQIHDRYLVWLGFAQRVLAAPGPVAVDNALDLHDKVRQGKNLMDALRQAIHTMTQVENNIREQRLAVAIVLERRELLFIAGEALFVGLLLSIFSLTHLRRVSRAYQQSHDQLQKHADELYEKHEWLETTLQSIGDAVIVCDAENRVEFMNPLAELLTGWPFVEALMKPLNQVFHIVDEHSRKQAVNPSEKAGRLDSVVGLASHTLLISRNDAESIIEDTAAPIRDKHGNIIGTVLVFRDVTEKRRTEAALIASEKLAVAGRLAASIAHEIYNPLDSVANLHYLLANETDPDKRAEYLHMAQRELNRTMQISRTMLGLYREPTFPVEVDLRELVEDVLLLLQRKLANQKITVERDFEDAPEIEGFPAELRQVFTNLIVNAADAAGPEGKIRIRITAAPPEESRGAGTLVEVLDNGPGISDEAAEKLFQPFFTTKGDQGTGLGLWVTLGIVQKHGGAITIHNSEDADLSGAGVRVYLPAQTLATSASRSTPHVS